MKLLRYGPKGCERPGILDENGRIRDLSQHTQDLGGASLLPNPLATLRALDPGQLPKVGGKPRIGPCVADIGKIIRVGLSYRGSHGRIQNDLAERTGAVDEARLRGRRAERWRRDPARRAEKTDWEVELGIVIGKPGKYIEGPSAYEQIAGFCFVNDLSGRSYQLERGVQWDKGKGCDTFAPIGPWLVTPDEICDPQALDLWLEVDGRRYQNGNARDMIFGIPHLIAYISQSLQSGDVIATGTPPGAGLGRNPPVYLRPGQSMRLAIDGLGVQQQRAVAIGSRGCG